jgi:protein ImuB
VDANAAAAGLHPGQALADARAMIPRLTVVRANGPADMKLLEEIADWCTRYTPLTALDLPHSLLLDVTGCTHLFGGERSMIKTVQNAIARQGFTVHLALAGTAEAARALACHRSGIIVPPGGEAEAMAPLPTEALRADPLVIHALRRAGLKTVGQVAERTRHELAARFGGGFVSLLDRTLGRQGSPITPRIALPDLIAERHFAEPILTEEVIADTLSSLARSLASLLESRGQGARIWQADFFRADGKLRHIAVETGQAVRDPAILHRLFREKLDSLSNPLDPGFGFDLIRLSATLAQNLTAESMGLDANAADEDVLFLIDRLAVRFGTRCVLRFQPQDTHIPEAASVLVLAQYAKEAFWLENGQPRPLRLFTRPEPVDVIASVPEGPPLRFRWRHVLHSVRRCEGPERIAMEWWRHSSEQPTRDYYRVEDDAGRRYWLYRDGIARETVQSRWFLHGMFA